MPAPKKNADVRLSIPKYLRLSVPLAEKLATMERITGLSEMEVVRRLIDETPLPSGGGASADPALIAALNQYSVALGRIGNNVNQLTAANWQGRGFVAYWREIGEELREDRRMARFALNMLLESFR